MRRGSSGEAEDEGRRGAASRPLPSPIKEGDKAGAAAAASALTPLLPSCGASIVVVACREPRSGPRSDDVAACVPCCCWASASLSLSLACRRLRRRARAAGQRAACLSVSLASVDLLVVRTTGKGRRANRCVAAHGLCSHCLCSTSALDTQARRVALCSQASDATPLPCDLAAPLRRARGARRLLLASQQRHIWSSIARTALHHGGLRTRARPAPGAARASRSRRGAGPRLPARRRLVHLRGRLLARRRMHGERVRLRPVVDGLELRVP